MVSRSREPASRHVQTLFDAGAVGGLTDGQLLDRFLSGQGTTAEAAFGVLVQRHGAMVLGVCRCVLKNRHDTEDAFQATFLVLARRADSIRLRGSLGHWLYGVARRVAVRSKVQAVRRRRHLRQFAEAAGAGVPAVGDRSDDLAVLYEEVGRLPPRLRAPVVLCYLEGLTYDEAARSLGVTEGTVRGRLARARGVLRTRLAPRGVTDRAFTLALAPAGALAGGAEVPPGLLGSTAHAASRVAADGTTTGVVSASVSSLTEGALNAMLVVKLKVVASAVLAVGLLCLGAGALAPQGSKAQSPKGADDGPGRPKSVTPLGPGERASAPGPQGPVELDDALGKRVPGRVLRASEVTKDCMVLSYLPDWAFGNVDNIGVANNDGGVRTLVEWPDVAADDVDSPDRRFLLAVYARKTTSHGKAGAIHAYELAADWPERTSWRTQPDHDPKPAATFAFEPGEGWKLFDVTPVVRARFRAGRKGHGVILRFLDEGRPGGGAWSGYQFVSREGRGEWDGRQPRLLVVEPSRK